MALIACACGAAAVAFGPFGNVCLECGAELAQTVARSRSIEHREAVEREERELREAKEREAQAQHRRHLEQVEFTAAEFVASMLKDAEARIYAGEASGDPFDFAYTKFRCEKAAALSNELLEACERKFTEAAALKARRRELVGQVRPARVPSRGFGSGTL